MRLAGAEEYQNAAATNYLADVRATFEPFANHPAIAATRALREQHGIAYDAPMELAAQLDDQLQPRGKLSELLPALDKRWTGVDADAYVAQLRAFAADSKFDAFFAVHRPYYGAVENRMRAALQAEHPADWFDSFFGAQPGARFVVIPGLLLGPNNYGVHSSAAGTMDMYQVLGLYQPDAKDLPVMNEQLLELLVHEMTHSFVNPVLMRHLDQLVPAADPLFAQVRAAMARQAYPETRIMVYESCVRAVTALYVRDRKGQAAADAAIADEVTRGFLWTPELVELMAKYRGDRTRYRDFEALVPDLVAFFTAQSKRFAGGVPFLGTVNDVFEHDYVIATSPDPAVASYAKQLADKFGKPLVPATAHVVVEHPHASVVAYGTPDSNPVIADVAHRAGWTIRDGEIALGSQKFTGGNLVLIACWPRDDDPERAIAVYAAAHEADVVGINSLRHGGTSWLVGRRRADGTFEQVAAGNFGRDLHGKWQLPR